MEQSFDLVPNPDLLEDLLSVPTPVLVEAMGSLSGDIVVLGASGKMGPTLARMALRASRDAGVDRRVWGVARFGNTDVRDRLSGWGIRTIAADLLQPEAVESLPDAPNVILMAGQKFGAAEDPATTRATNVELPERIARRYRTSRIVVFCTGNVYPLTPVSGGGSTEDDPLGPIGEYARTAVERERVLTKLAIEQRTPMAVLRLNYAIEPRYGVFRDIADRVYRSEPVDLTMGHVNVIWQRDANEIALRLLAHCSVPPLILNVTGAAMVSVREVARAFGQLFGIEPVFESREADTALLSNAGRCHSLLGTPSVSWEEMIDRVGKWVMEGGASLGKPTGFQEREGRF
jgi:nucleoside-diphosphate-sugar epimerase